MSRIRIFLISLLSLTLAIWSWGPAVSSSYGADFIKFGGGHLGGTWFTLVGGMSELLTKEIEGLNVSLEASAGSVDNNRLIRAGAIDTALTHALTVYDNWNGVGLFKGKGAFKDIRMLARVYESWHHFVTVEGTGIKTMADLEGKIVTVGSAGSGGAVNSENILRALGLWDKIKPRHLTFADGGRALGDGHVDALGQSSAPMANVVTLEATHKIRMVEFTPEDLDTIVKKFPAYSKSVMPAGTYKTWKKDYPTISFFVYWIAHKRLADKWAYEMLKVAFDPKNKEYLKRVHRQWAPLAAGLDTMKALGIPLHPGAVKFWKEKGLEIPPELIPGS